MQVYYTSADEEHKYAGHYVIIDDGDGGEVRRGPYLTRDAALDDVSGGVWSDYKRTLRDDHGLGTYREQMIDAGRGHLLRDGD